MNFFHYQVIVGQVKLGEWVLAMEGMMVPIMDILHCTNIELTLGIITMLSGDQATIAKLKETWRSRRS